MDGSRDRRLAVAFVASSGLMSMRIALDVQQKMAAMPDGSTILLRSPKNGSPGTFETVAAELAKTNGHVVRWMMPRDSGRSAVYKRDYELVESADRVEAYFAVDRVMEGGTGHVVEAAMARECPVYAWAVDHGGLVERVGEIEPDH